MHPRLRLEAEGLAEHQHDDGGQGPTRKVFRLTDEGREALGEWRSHIEMTKELLDCFIAGEKGG